MTNKAFVYIDSENIPMKNILGPCIDRLKQDKELNLISIKVFEKYFDEIPKDTKNPNEKKIDRYEKLKMLNDLYIKYNIEPIQCLETKSRKNSIDMKIVKVIHDDLKNCKFDIVVIFTNDRDFLEAAHTCKEQGKELWIVGDTSNISRLLKEYCDLFIDYNDPYNSKLDDDIETMISEKSHIIPQFLRMTEFLSDYQWDILAKQVKKMDSNNNLDKTHSIKIAKSLQKNLNNISR